MIDRLRRNWWFILGVALALIAIVLALLYKPIQAQTPTPTPTPTIPPLPIGQPLYLELGTVYTVMGSSMVPVINVGDWVLIKPGKEKPKLNQIVFFFDYLSSGPVMHRVIELGADLEGWWGITKGDNNPRQDLLYLRESNLIGIVKWRIQVFN